MQSPCLEYKYVIVGDASHTGYADSWEEIEGNRTVMLTQPPADGSGTVLLDDTYGVKDTRSARERAARAMQGYGQHSEPAAFFRGGQGYGPFADAASASYSSLHSAMMQGSPSPSPGTYTISAQHSVPAQPYAQGYMSTPMRPGYGPPAEQQNNQGAPGVPEQLDLPPPTGMPPKMKSAQVPASTLPAAFPDARAGGMGRVPATAAGPGQRPAQKDGGSFALPQAGPLPGRTADMPRQPPQANVAPASSPPFSIYSNLTQVPTDARPPDSHTAKVPERQPPAQKVDASPVAGISGSGAGGPAGQPSSPLPQQDPSGLTEEAVQSAAAKLVVVTFKLPLIVERAGDGEWSVKRSRSILNQHLFELQQRDPLMKTHWVGWPGIFVEDGERDAVRKVLAPYNCIPVFHGKKPVQDFLIFHEKVLKPLFHNFKSLNVKHDFDEHGLWKAYERFNAAHVDTIMSICDTGVDLVWIHDTYLLLLPAYMRRRDIHGRIGFSLHAPWPSSDIYKMFQYRSMILKSLLCCDLISFHIFQYARHFYAACQRLMGLNHTYMQGGRLGIEYYGRTVMLRISHIGVEVKGIGQSIRNLAAAHPRGSKPAA